MKSSVYLTISIILIALLSLIVFFSKKSDSSYFQTNDKPVPVYTDPVPVQYIGKVKADGLSIRLLVLKHCFESMADGDARLAIQAANLAADKGLNIRDIGNRYVNQEGEAHKVAWGEKHYSIDGFKQFVSEQMKINAEPGDTLIVFTIGHGFSSGSLQILGGREGVMKALADAAEENDQETLWWQLSCYAQAGLPRINDLPPAQQTLFSVLSSSNANHTSAAYVQGKHMEKLFLAMAEKDKSIDPNEDDTIVAKELADFLNRNVQSGRGDLLFAKSPDEPIFGFGGLARRIPVIDRNNPQQRYPRNYIPLPNR